MQERSSEDRKAEGAVADKAEETFLYQPSNEKRLTQRTKKLFYFKKNGQYLNRDTIWPAAFPPRPVCHRRYRVTKDLMRSAYLWDS